jgi:hypothetical protein
LQKKLQGVTEMALDYHDIENAYNRFADKTIAELKLLPLWRRRKDEEYEVKKAISYAKLHAIHTKYREYGGKLTFEKMMSEMSYSECWDELHATKAKHNEAEQK